jgi:S-adenosylmethionine/arginine decarboxylase-like enzyme
LASYTHRTADFHGVSPALLRDGTALSGLLVAAAGAAGLSSSAAPLVRERGATGVSAVLMLEAEGCHIAAHAFAKQKLLLLDVLVPAQRETDKVVDVFVRKLSAKNVSTTAAARG